MAVWTYHHASHELFDPQRQIVGINISANCPIPCGLYIIGILKNSPIYGTASARLIPFGKISVDGRTGFYIHGIHNEQGIVLDLNTREIINKSDIRTLLVI